MIITLLHYLVALGLASQALIGLSFLISCIWEKEKRATFYALLQFLGMAALFILFIVFIQHDFSGTTLGNQIFLSGFISALILAFLLLRRTKINQNALKGTKGLILGKVERQDERSIIFARNRAMRPGTKEYQQFYEEYPQYKKFDDARRKKGGVLGHAGAIDGDAGHPNVAMLLASLSIPHHLSKPSVTTPEPHFTLKKRKDWKKTKISSEEAALRVKGYAKSLGAKIVGITEIDQKWVYSKRGEIFNENWEDWGKEIKLTHKYAIVFGVEMDFEMVRAAPHTPTALESMHNYGKGAYIATQLAAFIANLGYSATANHLRHWDLNMVPLAVDAGLGELSRMGYLITKELGPRLRLGGVSTDLPLAIDKPVDIGVEHFCKICKKCATSCPSRSIPNGEQAVINGSLRWKLDEQKCFGYWAKVGTDCNICMRVCPWSHARTFPHKLIVKLISRNSLARHLFALLDDVFYGYDPKPGISNPWSFFKKKGPV